jgi:hypothetical protein
LFWPQLNPALLVPDISADSKESKNTLSACNGEAAAIEIAAKMEGLSFFMVVAPVTISIFQA